MNHIINQFDAFIEFDLKNFYEEWKTEEYKKISECLSYESLKVTIDFVNILRKYIVWEALSIREMLLDRE